jgi:hypothetical protein
MKKVGAFTLGKLKTDYEEDPKKNFELRIQMEKGLIQAKEDEEK